MDIKSRKYYDYTEEEKDELFEKLEKISKLVGINVKIEKLSGENNCHVNISDSTIGITKDGLHKDVLFRVGNNIDKYTLIDKNEYLNIPYILIAFMHELSHLITIPKSKCLSIVEKYYKFMWIMDVNDYRNIPYEKLADNLGYELIAKNYDSIINILLGKVVDIPTNIVNQNIKLAKRMKQLYIID